MHMQVVCPTQANVDIGPFHAIDFDLGHPGQLLSAAVLEQRVAERLRQELHLWVCARTDSRPHTLLLLNGRVCTSFMAIITRSPARTSVA